MNTTEELNSKIIRAFKKSPSHKVSKWGRAWACKRLKKKGYSEAFKKSTLQLVQLCIIELGKSTELLEDLPVKAKYKRPTYQLYLWMLEEKGFKSRIKCVYCVGYDNFVKVGYSSDFSTRLDALQTANPNKLTVFKIFEGKDMNFEQALHHKLRPHRIRGEWFHINKETKDILGI